MPLKRTPLYDTHTAAGAKLVDFGGWEMPLNYGSQIEEHHAVRRDAGMFDVSHMRPVDLEEMTHEGATLVIRSGGGRSGEAFNLTGERNTIGRSPEAEVFLDDVTVSRNHALLVRRRDGLYIDDLGSLNGTYVNRRRIESHRLQDGDELQVGKYKLTYLEER